MLSYRGEGLEGLNRMPWGCVSQTCRASEVGIFEGAESKLWECVYQDMEDHFIVVKDVPGPITTSYCALKTARLLSCSCYSCV